MNNKDNFIASYGAAREVTGSMHLLSLDLGTGRDGKKIRKNLLLDCGSFQGSNATDKNLYLPPSLDVSKIDFIFLTHSHLDHVGRLPVLAQRGFRGSIICTSMTKNITLIVLEDSLKIQDEDEERGYTRIWSAEDLDNVKSMFDIDRSNITEGDYPTWSWKDEKNVEKIRVRFLPSQHILGSASILIEKPVRFLYTGDLGGGKGEMHITPKVPNDVGCVENEVDYLMIESTYGDRHGLDRDAIPIDILRNAIEDMRARKGRLLIATLAIDRTEEILRMLKKLGVKDKVYLDSPMGADLLRLYIHNRYLLSKIAEEFGNIDISRINDETSDDELKTLFRPENFEIVRSRRISKKIADNKDSCIVVASSGMLEGGRIMEHLPGILESEKNILLFTGYQAEGTLGREILDGVKEVKIKTRKQAPHWERNLIMESNFVDTSFDGDRKSRSESRSGSGSGSEIIGEIETKLKIKCSVRKIEGLSAHADQGVLLEYINGFKVLPSKIFIVHGERKGAEILEEKIRERFRIKTIINEFDREYSLDESSIIERLVIKDIANVNDLLVKGMIHFRTDLGICAASFGGYIIDEGRTKGYKLVSGEEYQKMLDNKVIINTTGMGDIDIGIGGMDNGTKVVSEKIKAVSGTIPAKDEFVYEMVDAFANNLISKNLVKTLQTSCKKQSEYMKIISNRIEGNDLILSLSQLEEKGVIITNDERNKLIKKLGDILLRSVKMDMNILVASYNEINREIASI